MDSIDYSLLDFSTCTILLNNSNDKEMTYYNIVSDNPSLTDDQKNELQSLLIKKKNNLIIDNELFPNYDDTELYNSIEIPKTSWQELNPNNLSYWEWLQKIGIRYFWGSQPNIEIQSTLLAVCCALNSAAIPPDNSFLGKDVQIPILNFNGVSRSGKTEGTKFIWNSYPIKQRALFPASSSPKSLRNLLHDLAWNGINYRPCIITIDNFSRKELARYESQGMRMLFLAVCKNQSIFTNANRDSNEGDGTIKFYTHSLKAVTTIEPVGVFTQEEQELRLRMLYFFTEQVQDWNSFAGWDFNDVSTIYKNLWSKENYKIFLRDYLYPIISKNIKEFPYPQELQAQTHLTIATGLFIGIWKNETEALDFFGHYWELVESLGKDSKGNLNDILNVTLNSFKISIESQLNGRMLHELEDYELFSPNTWINKDAFIEEIKKRKLIQSLNKSDEDLIFYFMTQNGWIYDTANCYFRYNYQHGQKIKKLLNKKRTHKK
jgi:hypothetical protein